MSNNPTSKQKLGEMIKARRVELDLTLNAVARMLMLRTGKVHTVAQIRGIEEGSTNYSIDLLINACELLELDISLSGRATLE